MDTGSRGNRNMAFCASVIWTIYPGYCELQQRCGRRRQGKNGLAEMSRQMCCVTQKAAANVLAFAFNSFMFRYRVPVLEITPKLPAGRNGSWGPGACLVSFQVSIYFQTEFDERNLRVILPVQLGILILVRLESQCFAIHTLIGNPAEAWIREGIFLVLRDGFHGAFVISDIVVLNVDLPLMKNTDVRTRSEANC